MEALFSFECARAHGRDPVAIEQGTHPFPSRTRKLSPASPKILGGRLPGKIGRCRNSFIFFAAK